jgi:hypothetical protein
VQADLAWRLVPCNHHTPLCMSAAEDILHTWPIGCQPLRIYFTRGQ